MVHVVIGRPGVILLGEGQPKYVNGPETALFQKRRGLYGLDLAREAAFRGAVSARVSWAGTVCRGRATVGSTTAVVDSAGGLVDVDSRGPRPGIALDASR